MVEEGNEIDRVFRDEARRRIARVRAIVEKGLPSARSAERAELWRHIHSLHGTASSLGHDRIGALSEGIATRLGAEGQPGLRDVPDDERPVVEREIADLVREVDAMGPQP